MKYIHRFFHWLKNIFTQSLSKSEIKKWLDSMEIINYKIRDDLTVDVAGDVLLLMGKYRINRPTINIIRDAQKTYSIPVKFNHVTGDFICCYNNLISMKGCPEFVGGNFNCNNNNLKSLKYCPSLVNGNFFCSDNILNSLYGIREIKGDLYIDDMLPFEGIRIDGDIVFNANDSMNHLEQFHLQKVKFVFHLILSRL